MVKRRKTKPSTIAKTKDNSKEKVVNASNSDETCSKHASSCADDSPSVAKKAKFDSNHSPRKYQKYVPPFTASPRVSSRLRNKRNSEILSSQEGRLFKDVEDEGNMVSNSGHKIGNTPGKSEQEHSAMDLAAKEEKTEKMFSNASAEISAKQIEVEVKKDSKKDEENISENISETSPERSGVETQSLTNKFKDEELQKVSDQCGQHDLQVPNVSELARRSHNQVETDGKEKEEKKIDECWKESMTSKLEKTTAVVEERMSDADALETTELNRDVVDPEMSDVGARIARNFGGARLEKIDAQVKDVVDLKTLAETCAKEEYIDVVTIDEEPTEIFQQVSQNEMQDDKEMETKTIYEEEKEDNKNGSHSLDVEKETSLDMISEEQQLQEHATVQSKATTACEETSTVNLDNPKLPFSDEKDDDKNNEPTKESRSLSSREIIKKSLPNSLVNDDTNAQITSKVEKDEIEECEAMSVDYQCSPAVTEKVEDIERKQVSVCDKNSEKASLTGSLESGGIRNLDEEKTMDTPMESGKEVRKNNQDVPSKVAASPEQEVPEKTAVESSVLKSSENSSTDIRHEGSQKMKTAEERIIASDNSIEEQSYTEEFKALEELLPADDMGLFDDVLPSKPQPVSVNNELPSGDGTIEFLISELNFMHCLVANHEQAVEDIKRQFKSSGKF